MNKKILIGSILVLTLLLLMPSIPAIQQKTIEDRAYNDLIEQLNFKDVKELKMIELIKHPILFVLVRGIFMFRIIRAGILLEISTEYNPHSGRIEFVHPLLFLRCIWLMETSTLIYCYLEDVFGW